MNPSPPADSGRDAPFRSTNRARPGKVLLGAVVVVAGLGAGVLAWQWPRVVGQGSAEQDTLIARVERGHFALEVTEKGELESSGNTELRCEVKSSGSAGTAILKIVPEGTNVKAGDFLVQLDSSRLDNELAQQQIAVNSSEALLVEAQNTFETAEIALQEYLEGTFHQEKQDIQSEIFVAEENLRRAQQYLLYSRRLAASGYITQLQLDADAFAVDNAGNTLGSVRNKLRVLEEFTKAKMVKQLESEIASAKAKWEAAKKSHEVELAKLREIEDQIAKCLIRAPSDGQVKYAHKSDSRGNNDFVIEEGAIIREHQVIVSLPDPSRMQVKVNINESLLDSIREGMPATIRSVALKDTLLSGHVTRLSHYSEPTSWRRGNVKEFAAYVKIDDSQHRLLPGMSAEVTIHCFDLPDAVKVPVQAVYAHGEDTYCMVRKGDRWEARKVAVGAHNEAFAVIDDGLSENEVVALNPRRYVERVDLPRLSAAQQQQIVHRQRQRAGTPGAAVQASAPSVSAEGREGLAARLQPAEASEGMFDKLDKNGDGKLTSDEWPELFRDRFQAADLNGDGSIDRAEFGRAITQFLADTALPEPRPSSGVGQ